MPVRAQHEIIAASTYSLALPPQSARTHTARPTLALTLALTLEPNTWYTIELYYKALFIRRVCRGNLGVEPTPSPAPAPRPALQSLRETWIPPVRLNACTTFLPWLLV